MRKKKILTMAAAVLAGMMAFGMGAQAVSIGNDGTYKYAADSTATSDTIVLKKDIQMYNTSGHNIYTPNVAYTYTAEPVTVSGTVTVNDGANSAVVKSGVAGVVTVSSSPSFAAGSTAVTATKDSSVTASTPASSIAKVSADLTLGVNIAGKITVPGIYRYVITDTTTVAVLTAAGIERPSGYDVNRYLDVYVVDNGQANGGVKLGGYVLFESTNASASISKPGGVTTVAGGEKSEGYDVPSETTEGGSGYEKGANKSDEYHTCNVKIEKEVTGNYGDRSHAFPFTITTAGDSAVKYLYKPVTGDEAVTTVGGSTELKPNLKHGEAVTLYGLPKNVTYSVTEKNDTNDTYKVTVTDESSTPAKTLAAEAAVAKDSTAAISAQSLTGTDMTKDTVDVKFTNKLDSVTPTGIFLRYAPYILMAAAAFALILGMWIRRRKEEE